VCEQAPEMGGTRLIPADEVLDLTRAKLLKEGMRALEDPSCHFMYVKEEADVWRIRFVREPRRHTDDDFVIVVDKVTGKVRYYTPE
jgi:hypothetical protein